MRALFMALLASLLAGPAFSQADPGLAQRCDAARDWAQAAGPDAKVEDAMAELVKFASDCLPDTGSLAASQNALGIEDGAEEGVDAARALVASVAAEFLGDRTAACQVAPRSGTCSVWQALQDRAGILAAASPRRVDLDNMSISAATQQVAVGAGHSYSPPQPPLFFCAFLAGEDVTRSSTCEDPELGGLACGPGCLDAYDAAIRALPAFNALHAAAREMAANGVEPEILAWAKEDNARWRSYLFGGDDAEPQPLWEIGLNSVVFGYTDAERARLPGPRNKQLVALRPSLGLEVYDSDGTKAELAGVIEVLGYRQWEWGDGASRRSQWGASAIAVYSPSEDAQDWGYGVLIKTPWLNGLDISVVTREESLGGQRTSIAFSTDVSKVLPRTGAAAACRIFGLEGCTGE